MEQPTPNPTYCTNNCGFYGSSKFEGMCSKCYREHLNRSNNSGRLNSFPSSFYSSSNAPPSPPPVTSQNLLQNQVVEEDSIPISSIENDNSADELKQENDSSLMNDSITTETTTSPIEKKKRNRCSWESCNKKLGLTGFDCRCGGQYCSLHRYANEHNCTFDYKEHGQNEIRKNMPLVQGERVRRI